MQTHYDENDDHNVDIMDDVLDPEEINDIDEGPNPDIDYARPF